MEFRNGIYEHLALDNSIGRCFSFIWWTRENIFADGDFGKGLKNFKKGVSSDDDERNTSSDVERIENAQNVEEDTKKDSK